MQQFFKYKKGLVAYSSVGTGQPIVLLHGFGEDSSIWQHQIEVLEKLGRVITPDIPGSGRSALLENDPLQPVTIETYADCIFELIIHLQLEKIILLGHSMGGYIALAYAEKYRDTLKGFGLLHSTAFADSTEKKEVRKRGIELIRKYGGSSFLKNTISNLFATCFKQNHADIVDALVEKGKAFTDEALIQYYQAMMLRPDTTKVLKHLFVPVLFIMGDEDVAAPMNDVLQQVHLPNIAYIHLLKQTGHMGMLEATEQFNKLLCQFIKDLTSLY